MIGKRRITNYWYWRLVIGITGNWISVGGGGDCCFVDRVLGLERGSRFGAFGGLGDRLASRLWWWSSTRSSTWKLLPGVYPYCVTCGRRSVIKGENMPHRRGFRAKKIYPRIDLVTVPCHRLLCISPKRRSKFTF